MSLPDSEVLNGSRVVRLQTALPAQTLPRRVVSMSRKTRSSQEGLEDSLASALQAADAELGHILREVDGISRILRSTRPDAPTLRAAVHPAVWCALKQALLDRELRCLALTDDLTCLYNRRGFFAAATQQLKLARRNGQGLLLLFCDLDDLKRINDSFGHSEGDRALVRASDALEQTFRASDILARLGGDEFVVVALEESAQAQEIVLQRLRKSLRKQNAGESRYELSMSVGVARFDPKSPVTLGELMAQADKAMYEQKRVAKGLTLEASQR